MEFKSIKDCRRPADEQRYIWATLRIWHRLPSVRRERIRALIGRIADTPEEGRALFDVTVRGALPSAVCARTGLPLQRVCRMRKEFYEKFEI